eukprot:SAG31_NODE_7632_length_1634_cov_1.851466_2_plen_91_part_00
MADEIVGGGLDLVANPIGTARESDETNTKEMVACPGLAEFGGMSRLMSLVSFGTVRKTSVVVPFFASGKGCYFLVFMPTIKEIRDFYREM